MAEDDKDDKDRGPEGEKEKRWWSDMMREMTSTGLATIFMTEDTIRSYLKDKKLPKEVMGQLLEGVGKKKDDLYGMFAKEFGRVLSKIDMSAEVGRFLEKHKVHFSATISFEPKEKTDKDKPKSEEE